MRIEARRRDTPRGEARTGKSEEAAGEEDQRARERNKDGGKAIEKTRE